MKAVIIKLGALGDIIMATPIIKTLLTEHHYDELSLLTSPQYAPLFNNWQHLSVKHFPRGGIGSGIRAAAWLRSEKFDRIYDLQSNDRSRILCCLSGAREKVGNHNCFPYTHHPGDRYTGQTHIFERHKQVLASTGITVKEQRPWLPVPEQALNKVDRWLNSHGLDASRLVLMHAGTSPTHPEKRWPHFGELAEMLVSAGYSIIWLGTEVDAKRNEQLAKSAGIDATDDFTVVELVALGRRASLAVTNDSGPMHVLACADLPVYAIFGPSNWRRNHAIGQRDNVVCPGKSNAVWRAEDFPESEFARLDLITAEMLWCLLLKEKRINE